MMLLLRGRPRDVSSQVLSCANAKLASPHLIAPVILAMLVAASCLPRHGHAAHGLDRRLPRGREALPGPGGGLRAGHQVSLATPRPFEPDARRLGLGFAPTEGNPRQVLETEQECVAGGRPPSAAWHTAAAGGGPSPGGPAAGRRDRRLPGRRGHHLRPVGVWRRPDRRAHRVPAVLASLLPLSPTRAFLARARPPGGWVAPTTLLSHLVAEQFGWQPFRG